MKPLIELLTSNLKALRKRLAITQGEAAERAGIPFRTYQEVEYGNRWPGVENLEAIAKALGVHASELFSGAPVSAFPAPTPEAALDVLSTAIEELRRLQSTASRSPDKSALVALIDGMDDAEAGRLLERLNGRTRPFVKAPAASDKEKKALK